MHSTWMDRTFAASDVQVGAETQRAGWYQRRFVGLGRRDHLSVRTVCRLRWWALGLQSAAVAVCASFLSPSIVAALGGLLGIGALSNLALGRIENASIVRALGATAVLDALLLTALLALTGGPTNPFSVLYLTYVMIAAISSNAAWTWTTVFTSSAGFGLLFFVSVPLPAALGGHAGPPHGQPYAAHLQGMWMAHTVTAAVIAWFVGRLATALSREQDMRAKTSRMLGLATLAAGAAHEIGNPLGTIRVAASELERELGQSGAPPETMRDLDLIGREVRRAHRVLERMSVGAGELLGEGPVPQRLDQVLAASIAALGAAGERISLNVPADETVRWPVQATAQALTQLMRNAVEASPPGRDVDVQIRTIDDGVQITITDEGPGMDRDTLARIGEPFFTTRPGRGQGLGVFIARSLVEHMHGRIQIDSSEGQGTVARVWLPREIHG